MSLFENFANKPSIVLDIGQAYTKCGFSGEAGPFAIVPTEVTKYAAGSAKSVRILDYRKLLDSSASPQKIQELLKEMLVEFLYNIYYNILNANSRERKVVVVESVLTTTEFRVALAEVLFNNFQVVSIAFLSSHLAALYTLGVSKGLVIDCGYTDCQIMPIAENMPLSGLCNFANLGGAAIHRNIERMLRAYAHVTLNGKRMSVAELGEKLVFTEEILEDIKLRCCFVTTFERAHAYYAEIEEKKLGIESFSQVEFKFAPDCDYNLPDNYTLHVPGYLREMALDFLFADKVDGKQTIQHLILDTINKSPIDLRRKFSENIVFIGGTCMLFGFKHRLVCEAKHLLNQNESSEYSNGFHCKELKYHQPPSRENYTAWLGGAIFGGLDNLDFYSISNAKYKEAQKLPDWFVVYSKQNEF